MKITKSQVISKINKNEFLTVADKKLFLEQIKNNKNVKGNYQEYLKSIEEYITLRNNIPNRIEEIKKRKLQEEKNMAGWENSSEEFAEERKRFTKFKKENEEIVEILEKFGCSIDSHGYGDGDYYKAVEKIRKIAGI